MWSRARTAMPPPEIRRRAIISTRIGTKGRATAYAPDSITTVTTNPGDPTDVVIEIRDVVYVGDLKPSAW